MRFAETEVYRTLAALVKAAEKNGCAFDATISKDGTTVRITHGEVKSGGAAHHV